MPEFQDVFENSPADWQHMSREEFDYVQFMYEEGFMHYTGEQSPADTQFAREQFFMYVDEETFDWSGWREAMYG
jgi:hypothetical protein